MVKPEWGTKRMCLNCGVRFYDLSKVPIACPACETEFAEEDFTRTRRGRSAAADAAPKSKPVAKAKPKKKPDVEAAEDEEDLVDVDVDVDDDGDEEEDNVIEDASELGEDDDDVAEIVDGAAEEKET